MRTIFRLAMVVAVAVASPGQGDAGVKFARENGDVNGDQTIDISDPVDLVTHLFLGGPPPVPMAPSPAAAGVPDTGQSKCYGIVEGQGLVEVPCDDPATCPAQDAAYMSGCPSEGRFEDNGDGTVTDRCTGLTWQKDTADVNGDGQISDPDRVGWCDALAHCEDLDFAGRDDWRLPNVRELQSIVDYGRFNPSIDPVFGAVSGRYWSSTTFAYYPGYAWRVCFYVGFVRYFEEDGPHYVRAVRGGL